MAERPEDLVVYGGTGEAPHDRGKRSMRLCAHRELDGDQTLMIQSGKPVAVFARSAAAPRVLIANANLVPNGPRGTRSAIWKTEGLTMYGQMTAGSWIYIGGTQGIVQGTYETLAEIGAPAFRRQLAARSLLPPASAAWAAPSRWRSR